MTADELLAKVREYGQAAEDYGCYAGESAASSRAWDDRERLYGEIDAAVRALAEVERRRCAEFVRQYRGTFADTTTQGAVAAALLGLPPERSAPASGNPI